MAGEVEDSLYETLLKLPEMWYTYAMEPMEPEETPVNRLKPLNDFAFQKIMGEVIKMDAGIQRAQEKMGMITADRGGRYR